MSSIFSKIIAGEIPCYKVAENDDFIAFLDVMPLVPGHVLVVPKKEVDYIFDLDSETYQGLWNFAHTLSLAVKKAIPCKRVGVAVIGLEVPHTHIHLVPLNAIDDINFTRPKLKLSPEEMNDTLEKIKACL